MDLSDVVSVKKFQEFRAEQKDELYETLLDLAQAIDEIPKKSLRKTLDITLAVLQYKGKQVEKLQETAATADNSANVRLVDENEKLKQILNTLEKENQNCTKKIRSLTDELFVLQRRLEEANNTEISDKDSSDPLSELDKQEELLKNINAKNKHIKRLLREIEALQTQNIEQSKTIIESEKQVQEARAKVLQLSADITLVDSERKALKETVNELQVEISRLEGNVTFLEVEREKSEKELMHIIKKLEAKAQSRKKLLEEKNLELKKFRTQLNTSYSSSNLKDVTPNSSTESVDDNTGKVATDKETTKLLHAIECRDKLIEQLELKIKAMAEEMLSSTKLMDKLSAERLEEQTVSKPRACCKVVEESLQAANKRCRELSELLENCEEDNLLKSKQALQAITALDAYQRGEDGLIKALKKCSSLEQKLLSRDKQIQALVTELNSMHEIKHENGLLRKRLNIPDDVVIVRNLAAKERSKDKMIDRLTLKLRASEEMRLRLKMQKTDLRTELLSLQKKLQHKVEESEDSIRVPSEIGEVEEVKHQDSRTNKGAICSDSSIEIELNPGNERNNSAISEYNYEEIVAENETLRQGMVEILEKLRDYDAFSEHITIDTEILLRLLQALQKPIEWPPATVTLRQENELQSLKLREKALKELLQQQENVKMDEELSSVESVREDGEVRLNNSEDLPIEMLLGVDSSTRPTTPNKTLNQSFFPIISLEESKFVETEQTREQQMQLAEFRVYRQRYEELIERTDESKLDNHEKALVERITKLHLELCQKSKCYEYLREDFDKALTEAREREVQYIAEIADLKKRINGLLEKTEELQVMCRKQKSNMQYSAEEYLALQRTNTELQTQVAYIVDHILNGKIAPELQINDICIDYGIIEENLQLDYLTADEYEQLQERAKQLAEERTDLMRKGAQLEGLLEIAQEQIQMQQKLLNDLTDNHINLRHLVADLQSTSDDKLIFAKIQRDLDTAKSEVNNLKLERELLQQKCVSLELKINVNEQETAQLKECFQVEQRLKDTKLKFLKKSLFTLKEKYAKFTPLIFLTNFTFSYARFIKRANEAELVTEITVSDRIRGEVEKLASSQMANFVELRDESHILIKLIKVETQNRMLEEQLASIKQSCRDLQEELTKQHIKRATDNEHWKTIEALFSPVTSEPSQAQITMLNKLDPRDPEAGLRPMILDTPVPAERKLSVASEHRKSLTEGECFSPMKHSHQVVDMEKRNDIILDDTEKFLIAKKAPDETKKQNNYEKRKQEMINQREDEHEKEYENDEVIEEEEEEEHDPESEKEDKEKEQDPKSEKEYKKEDKDKDKGKVKQEEKEKEQEDEKSEVHESLPQKTNVMVQTSKLCVESFGVQTSLDDLRDQEITEEDSEKVTQKYGETQTDFEESVPRLNNTNAELSEAKLEINELRKQIETFTAESNKKTQESKAAKQLELNQQSDIIEKTILSFHTLLSEKDKSISKYQDLLKTEQDEAQESMSKLIQDIKDLKHTLHDLTRSINDKDMEIQELKNCLETVSVRKGSSEKPNLTDERGEECGDNSLNEISDEKIEEMFDRDTDSVTAVPLTIAVTTEPEKAVEEKQDTETLGEAPTLTDRIKELTDKTCYLENTLKIKEDEIILLREKLKLYQEQDKSMEHAVNPEIEHLNLLVEEKNQHINELIAILNNFHDDQQRYINDSTNSSADQISKLAADLTRNEATNKIYRTEVEALRRQLSSLTQREKNARELSQSLRNELIKRPVVSIKTELNARVKNENLNKRIQQLELDLKDAQVQIQRQNAVISARRAKSSLEVNLWEKQKRWQQNAEKCKAKLDETESILERTKSLLNTARNTISRLEKEKQVLEVKLGRETHAGASSNVIKCSNKSFCSNLHPAVDAKYTSSETPETYTGGSSDYSSPAHTTSAREIPHIQRLSTTHTCCVGDEHHQAELIEALKARSELQQRKIAAMELEGKGSNALTTELEKLQEKFSACEAQNIRLEAKNLQLQLDNDLLRQGDSSERLQKRIKHLEDYIIALKEEMAQCEARRELCKCTGTKSWTTQSGQSAEQTILSLKSIVEKLRAENKYLKDSRRFVDSKSSIETPTELSRLQSKSLEKIATVQTNCPVCRNRKKVDAGKNDDELNFIREQLVKKTQLLQKAKVLLTRAAAKEKVLKEQLALWKRKCSELQNVPVIDEISE